MESGSRPRVEEPRFLADRMLGRLAKWLRILGYDTRYLHHGSRETLRALASREGRILLTREHGTWGEHPGSVLVWSDHVHEQLRQLVEGAWIRPDPERAFHRCPVCNRALVEADEASARDHVPEYVFYRHRSGFRMCPGCGRYYWSGTHRDRMRAQLAAWGLIRETP